MRSAVRLWCAALVVPAGVVLAARGQVAVAFLFVAVGWTLGALVDKCLCYQTPARPAGYESFRHPRLERVVFTGEPNPEVLPAAQRVRRVRHGDVERVRKLRALADDPRTPGPERVNARDKIRRIEDMRS